MCIGWCDFYGMNQPCSSIHSNMALHSEAPFVALLCLVHLGIALLFRVLGRTRCIDDCRIDDRAAPHDIFDIPTFNESVVREAILNAVSHRNYQLAGSVFIRQFPDRLVIESPGGLPNGISLDNILDRQIPRNRRIAEILALCGLVERSGQGMNIIYETSVKEAKPLPDFAGTDDTFVSLALNGLVIDKQMLSVINRIGNERLDTLTTADFLTINALYYDMPLDNHMKENRKLLKEVLKDIERDMTDEEVLALLVDSRVSVNPSEEKGKDTLGQRAADTIAKFAGSWACIFSFTGVLVLWMVVNTVLASKAFDPYPFILLNLVLSCVAAIQAPLIMMSQNRQEEKDRRRAENDYKVNLKTEIMIEDLYDKINAMLAKQTALEKRLLAQSHGNDGTGSFIETSQKTK